MLSFYLSIIDTNEQKSKFEQIYHQYRNLMFYIANQILHDESLAEDAVQDAFLKIIENLSKIDEVDCHKTKSYIVIIVRNHSINLYHQRKRKQNIPLFEVEHTLFGEDTPPDFDELGDLSKAVLQLPVTDRDLITLKYVHEFTNPEIAQALGLKEATVRKRLERAKQKILILLEKEESNDRF